VYHALTCSAPAKSYIRYMVHLSQTVIVFYLESDVRASRNTARQNHGKRINNTVKALRSYILVYIQTARLSISRYNILSTPPTWVVFIFTPYTCTRSLKYTNTILPSRILHAHTRIYIIHIVHILCIYVFFHSNVNKP